jgi:arylsulfatase A-like enzyme
VEQELITESRRGEEIKLESRDSIPVRLHPQLLLASIAAFFCLQLEVAVLEQIDSLTQYMTRSEIALDAAVALLIVLGVAGVWWLCILLMASAARLVPFARSHRVALAWYFGLLLPFSYFALSLVSAAKTLLFPGLQAQWLIALLVLAVCLLCFVKIRLPQLQNFCRTRLAPIAWIHVALAVIAGGTLLVQGVHFFHNYQRPGERAAVSTLPDIYLISFDALAAEDMSLYGYHLPTTPRLDQFAKQSFTFNYFFANSNFTGACTTSMETGKLPWTHRVFHQGGFLRGAAQGQNLAAELHRLGYYTAMITSNPWSAPFRHRTMASYDAVQYVPQSGTLGALLRFTNLIGVNTQYTLYGALFRRLTPVLTYIDAFLWPHRYPAPAEPVFERAQTFLEDQRVAQPRFLWTHILPPHDPYLPPAFTRKHFLASDKLTRAGDLVSSSASGLPLGATAAEFRERYDEMVLYADTVVGNYLDWLQRTGRSDHAIVIVTSDHGESFEHGTFLHGGPTLYEGMIRVPLLIHLPGQRDKVRVSQVAQEADLLPTLLALVGAPAPSWTDGVSLKPAIEGGTLPERYTYSMNLEPARIFAPISVGTVAIRDDQFKYVIRLGLHQESLYRYKEDPLEEHNLITSDPDVAARLRNALFSQLNQVNQQARPKP